MTVDRIPEDQIRAAVNRARLFDIDPPAGLTCAAVLIPLIPTASGWDILFTRRTDQVETHKGQVAFPGGACDPQDHGPEATALREAFEEVGLQPGDVRVLGCLPPMSTVTGYLVTPVVGVIDPAPVLRLAENEVSRAFYVPMEWLLDPSNREDRLYTRSNGTREMVVFYQPYDGETIWGVTARILVDFLALIEKPGA